MPGRALSELRSLQSEHRIERRLHRAYANGAGSDSAYAEFFLSGEERQLGNTPLYWSFEERGGRFAAARDWVPHWPHGGQIRSRTLAFDAVQWQGWSFRPALTLRDTFYTEQGNAANSTTAADDI